MHWARSSLCSSHPPCVHVLLLLLFTQCFCIFLSLSDSPGIVVLCLSLSCSCLHLYHVFAHHNLWQIRIGLWKDGGSVVNYWFRAESLVWLQPFHIEFACFLRTIWLPPTVKKTCMSWSGSSMHGHVSLWCSVIDVQSLSGAITTATTRSVWMTEN